MITYKALIIPIHIGDVPGKETGSYSTKRSVLGQYQARSAGDRYLHISTAPTEVRSLVIHESHV